MSHLSDTRPVRDTHDATMPTAPTPPKALVLVVDDNEVNRLLLASMLQRHGFLTDTAENGEDALAKLKHHTFDLILLDIMMPIMNGIVALEYIRQDHALDTVPVIMISAMSDTNDIVRALELGANDYLTKPIDMQIAMARVKTQITMKQLMDERKRTMNRMKETRQIRQHFFQIASHDLKGPLNNLRVSHTILAQLVPQEYNQAHNVLRTMRATIDSMTAVIADFLDSAALQSGEVEIQLACNEVYTLVSQTVNQNMPTALEKRIDLQVGGLVGNIFSDPARTLQILNNLITNAIKYSPQGALVRIWSEYDGTMIRICVADQGPGIPFEERHKLFQPFGRLSNEPTGNESSHGLGLWIAKHLTTLMNGEIDYECPPLGGTIFWIAFPSC